MEKGRVVPPQPHAMSTPGGRNRIAEDLLGIYLESSRLFDFLLTDSLEPRDFGVDKLQTRNRSFG